MVETWKHFPRYWLIVRGIHRSPVNSVTRRFDVFLDLCPNKQLSKQSWGWWFETPPGSLWRHSNESLGIQWNRHIYVAPRKENMTLTVIYTLFGLYTRTGSNFLDMFVSYISNVRAWTRTYLSVYVLVFSQLENGKGEGKFTSAGEGRIRAQALRHLVSKPDIVHRISSPLSIRTHCSVPFVTPIFVCVCGSLVYQWADNWLTD